MNGKLITFLIILIIYAIPAFGSEFYSEDNVVISSDENVDDDVYVFANTCEIYGEIAGDYSGFIYNANIDGIIDGNVNLFAYTSEVEGIINRSCRLFCQNIDVGAEINGNLLAMGQNVTVGRKAVVGRDANIYGSIIYIYGTIEGETRVECESVIISGKLSGDLIIEAKEITLTESAVVAGDIFYTSQDEIYIEDGADLLGAVDWTIPEDDKDLGNALDVLFNVTKLLFFLMSLVTGLILILLFGSHARKTAQYIETKLPQSLGIGFVSLIIFTFGAVLLAIFVVSLPLSIFVIFLGIFLFYVGKLYCSIVIGRFIFRLFGNKSIALGWAFIVGLIVLALIFEIPYFGALAYLLALLIGAGGAVGAYLAICRKRREEKTGTEIEPAA